MPFPGMTFAGRGARKPAPSRSSGAIFSVGGRAFINGPGGREDRVSLVDEKNSIVQGKLIDGAEVEILGWLPRGPATRYHIRSTRNDIVGWIGVAQLRATRRPRSAEAAAKGAPAAVWIAPATPDGRAMRGPAPTTPVAAEPATETRTRKPGSRAATTKARQASKKSREK